MFENECHPFSPRKRLQDRLSSLERASHSILGKNQIKHLCFVNKREFFCSNSFNGKTSLFIKENSKIRLSILSTVYKSVAVRIPSVISAANVSILFVVLGLLRGLIRGWILDDVD